MRDDDRRAQPIVELQPFLAHPIVDRARELRGDLRPVVAIDAGHHLEHRVVDAPLVEQLGAQQLGIAAGDVSRLVGPGVEAGARAAGAGIGVHLVGRAAPIPLHVAPGAGAQIGHQHGRHRLSVDVAIDQPNTALGPGPIRRPQINRLSHV